jgi:hypothetical protein
MIRRFLLGVLVPAIAAAAVVAPAASAMPMRDGYSAAGMHANKVHHRVRPAALVDAAAHADTMRRLGARIAPGECA